MKTPCLALPLIAAPAVALADTGTVATVETGPLVLTLVGAAVAVLRWVVKRELAALARTLGDRLTPGHAAAIDEAIDRAAAAVEPLLGAVADQAVRTRLAPALARTEAAAILRYLPQAAAALGLTQDTVEARIAAALGDPLHPTQGASP